MSKEVKCNSKQIPLLIVIEAGESECRFTIQNSSRMVSCEAIKRINDEILNKRVSKIDIICEEKRSDFQYIEGFLAEVKKIADNDHLPYNIIYEKSDSLNSQ